MAASFGGGVLARPGPAHCGRARRLRAERFRTRDIGADKVTPEIGRNGTYRMLTRTTIGAVSDARYRALAAFGRRVPVRHIEEASRTGPRWLIGVTNSDIACDVRVR